MISLQVQELFCFLQLLDKKAKPKGFKAVMPLGGVSTQPLIAVSEWLK